MKTLIKKLLWIGLIIVVIKGFFQFEFYYSEPVFGWVIDAETGERLEGVTVEAQWKEQRGSNVEKNNTKIMRKLITIKGEDGFYRFPEWKEQQDSSTEENNSKLLQKLTSITNKDGFYRFPEWEPRLEFGLGIITDKYSNRPTLYFIKEGYKKKILHCYSYHHSGFLFSATKMEVGCCDAKEECCSRGNIKLYKLPSINNLP
jgi:hypothetical protein